MTDRDKLTVDDDDGEPTMPSKDDSETPPKPSTKRLKKGWKDPADPLAVGKYKLPSGNICEDM